MRSLRIALKYLVIGLAAGLLIAPRSGRDTRDQLLRRLNGAIEQMTGATGSEPPPATQF